MRLTQESKDVGRTRYAGLLLVLLLGVLLRLYQLGTESIWNDEAFSLRDAAWPPVGGNKMRPIYYLFMHYWMPFGHSEVWLRLPSVLCGIASIYLTYRIAERLAGQSVALISAFVLALSPLEINHSQEVRMYEMASFLGLAG